LSLACVACCKVISAAGHCRVQRSPTACGVSECDRGTSQRRARPTTAVEHCLKNATFEFTKHLGGCNCSPRHVSVLEKVKCTVHPCTGTEALYRPYGP
jgi:hypothetical protein